MRQNKRRRKPIKKSKYVMKQSIKLILYSGPVHLGVDPPGGPRTHWWDYIASLALEGLG